MSYFYKPNDSLEGLINEYFSRIDKLSKEKYQNEISVILLGSLSRGEGTWIDSENGPRMLSDIEYFTVFPKGFTKFDELDEFILQIQKDVFGSQNSKLFHIDNTYICRHDMSRLEKKLLTYDAKIMGKSVAGPDDTELLPEINVKNINLIDIKDILTHRIFSVLYYGLPLKEQGNAVEYRYSLAKNSLDLMTVMLVCNKKLESGFIKRLEAIKKLDIDKDVKEYFEFCLSIKLSNDCEFHYETEQMEKMFIRLIKLLKTQFKIPFSNILTNFKVVTRRFLGIVKRALKCKRFPSLCHLDSLIDTFEKGQMLSKKQKLNNLIINGYPVEQKGKSL